MSMPVQKPGRSKQDYGTPVELIEAVTRRFGPLTLDLAANQDGSNAKAPRWLWDSFNANWEELINVPFCEPGIGWLNPPFADIDPWAEKCKLEAHRGARIIMLTPASIGAEWFAKHVENEAHVIALRPRLIFEGCKDPYPKDCMLSVFGDPLWVTRVAKPFSTWRWRA